MSNFFLTRQRSCKWLNNGSRYCILALIHILTQYFLPLKLDLVSPRPDTERIQLLARQKIEQQRLFGSHLCQAIFILLQSMPFGIQSLYWDKQQVPLPWPCWHLITHYGFSVMSIHPSTDQCLRKPLGIVLGSIWLILKTRLWTRFFQASTFCNRFSFSASKEARLTSVHFIFSFCWAAENFSMSN